MIYRFSTENATIAALKLTHALQNPTPSSPLSNIGEKQMEALHQLAKLFQQSRTTNENTSNFVALPNMTQTQQEPQAKIPTATPKHDAHPHCPNIIEDDNGNQPQKLTHKNQPLRLGLPPQRNTSTPHYIPPDSGTSQRVTPSPRVKQSPRYQTL